RPQYSLSCNRKDRETEAAGGDTEEIPAENPGEKERAAGSETGCGFIHALCTGSSGAQTGQPGRGGGGRS
ncbi:hypothetical protein AAFF_G00407170, partial [Aldrovandia affinis]